MVRWHSDSKVKSEGHDRSCFVISPIGQPGSDMRMHADAVLEFIIKPAFEMAEKELGYKLSPGRSDHKLNNGNIVSELIDHILNDKIIIAVLTYARHNVYYELGIAHAAGRRPILLFANNQMEDLPFDISQDSYIGYEYDPAQLKKGTVAQELSAKLVSILNEKKTTSKPFGREIREFKPFGGEHAHFRFFPEFKDLKMNEWMSMVEGARQFIAICEPGLAMSGSLHANDMSIYVEALQKRIDAGTQLSIMYSPPTMPPPPTGEVSKRELDAFRDREDEYNRRTAGIERLRNKFSGNATSSQTVNWVELKDTKDTDCYLLTDEGCLIARGTLDDKRFGSRTALWASSQLETEFHGLYSASFDDIQKLSIRNGGKDIQGRAAYRDDPLRESRLEPFWVARDIIERAREFIVIMEPTYTLCCPNHQHDDDRSISHWREKIRSAIGARVLADPCRVSLISYSANHPLFSDEMQRTFPDLNKEQAIKRAEEAISSWDELFRRDFEDLPPKNRIDGRRWRVGTISSAVISERAIITDKTLMVVPLLTKVGHDICAPIIRDKSTPEYARFKQHAHNISFHDHPTRNLFAG